MNKKSIQIEWVEGSQPTFTYKNLQRVSEATSVLNKCLRDAVVHLHRGIPLCPEPKEKLKDG